MRTFIKIYRFLFIFIILDHIVISKSVADALSDTIDAKFSQIAATVDANRFIITIIDTGIDLTNQDLAPMLWTNPGESGLDSKNNDKSTNGIDDDGNGFVDDIHGWNFFNNTAQIQDNHGHGTHIAGIIANELKRLKIANKFCFQVVKYFDTDTASSGLLKASNQSFLYSLNNQGRLINYSGGGYEYSKDEQSLMIQLKQKNIPLIAALGNQNLNTDTNPFFPASYGLENIFAIGAAERTQTSAKFSNYGHRFLDFLTPGVQIESYGLNGSKAYLSGTSQSTATATAVVAYLMYQQSGQINWKDLKNKIKNLRSISHTKHENENPLYIDSAFIAKHKTTALDAFGEPAL